MTGGAAPPAELSVVWSWATVALVWALVVLLAWAMLSRHPRPPAARRRPPTGRD